MLQQVKNARLHSYVNTMTDTGFHFSQRWRLPKNETFFSFSLYLIMFIILIYVAFRCLTALGPPFFSPKDRSKIKLRPGREATSAIFMSAVKCGSSRSINISFAFNRRSNNVHTVIGSLKILFFLPQTPFYSPLKIIDVNFMLILPFESVHNTVFILVFHIRE